MATSIRLSRGGSKKRPYYKIVVADSRSPRDGRFIERIGSYNPLLPKDHADRIKLDVDRAKRTITRDGIDEATVQRGTLAERQGTLGLPERFRPKLIDRQRAGDVLQIDGGRGFFVAGTEPVADRGASRQDQGGQQGDDEGFSHDQASAARWAVPPASASLSSSRPRSGEAESRAVNAFS